LREETKTIAEIKHPSVRECLNFVNLNYGVEIQHNADLPAMSGLGSSSAFTVGLLNALYALKGEMIAKRRLALEAIRVEQDMIKENVGSQDQSAAAFGGFNKIEFGGTRQDMGFTDKRWTETSWTFSRVISCCSLPASLATLQKLLRAD